MEQETCFQHPDRPAVKHWNIPCAPNGKLPVCEECAKPENFDAVAKTYLSTHKKRVQTFKAQPWN